MLLDKSLLYYPFLLTSGFLRLSSCSVCSIRTETCCWIRCSTSTHNWMPVARLPAFVLRLTSLLAWNSPFKSSPPSPGAEIVGDYTHVLNSVAHCLNVDCESRKWLPTTISSRSVLVNPTFLRDVGVNRGGRAPTGQFSSLTYKKTKNTRWCLYKYSNVF